MENDIQRKSFVYCWGPFLRLYVSSIYRVLVLTDFYYCVIGALKYEKNVLVHCFSMAVGHGPLGHDSFEKTISQNI